MRQFFLRPLAPQLSARASAIAFLLVVSAGAQTPSPGPSPGGAMPIPGDQQPTYPLGPAYPPPYPPPYPPAPAYAPIYPPAANAYAPGPIDPRPRYLPYRDGEPPPPGYNFDDKVRRGPIVGGLITLGVPYLLGLLVASEEDYNNKKGFLVVPGLGPWLTLLTRSSTCDPSLPISDCSEDFNARFALVLDGLLQTAGAILVAHGILNTKKRYIRSDWSSFTVAPRLVGQSPGLGVSSQF